MSDDARKERQRLYYLDNREKIIEQSRLYYQEHREEYLERDRLRRAPKTKKALELTIRRYAARYKHTKDRLSAQADPNTQATNSGSVNDLQEP